MSKYGQLVILGNRFLAGTRSVISLTAGITDLNLSKTIVNSLISSALWNALLIALGWLLKENWIMIGEYLSTYGRVVLIVVILLVISRLIYVRLMGKNAQDSV
jgi:membrane protein DedA with SNARE-associated domain